jgi:putative endopeptidase
MLAKSGYPEEKEYVVQSPQLLAKLNEVYTQKNLPLLKDYLIVHAVMDCAEILDRECYEWHYAYKNAISGASGMLPDEEAFSVSVAEKLEWPVARFYSETYLKESDK